MAEAEAGLDPAESLSQYSYLTGSSGHQAASALYARTRAYEQPAFDRRQDQVGREMERRDASAYSGSRLLSS